MVKDMLKICSNKSLIVKKRLKVIQLTVYNHGLIGFFWDTYILIIRTSEFNSLLMTYSESQAYIFRDRSHSTINLKIWNPKNIIKAGIDKQIKAFHINILTINQRQIIF